MRKRNHRVEIYFSSDPNRLNTKKSRQKPAPKIQKTHRNHGKTKKSSVHNGLDPKRKV